MTDFYEHFKQEDQGGKWRVVARGRGLIMPSGLIHRWGVLPEYEPKENDVQFWWGPHYNFNMSQEEVRAWLDQYHILSLQEIVEVFREPFSDVDGGFKGRTVLIASFERATEAIFFKMAVS